MVPWVAPIKYYTSPEYRAGGDVYSRWVRNPPEKTYLNTPGRGILRVVGNTMLKRSDGVTIAKCYERFHDVKC